MTSKEKDQIKRLKEEGHGYKKISRILGISENTVKSYFKRKEQSEGDTEKQSSDDETCTCQWCGLPVKQSPGRKVKRFCSDECRAKWWGVHSGDADTKALYHFECAYCHKPFTAYGNAGRKYCCHECYIADRFGGGHHE